MNVREEIQQKHLDLQGSIYTTPLLYSQVLSDISGAEVYLKLELQQRTGSFKIRGMFSKLRSLTPSELAKTLVASSTGNHAAAFIYAAEILQFRGVLFLPETITKAKLKALKSSRVRIELFGKNSVEAEEQAFQYAKEHQGILIHPYNDINIIKGQATLGCEIEAQLGAVDTVYTPIGGGGLAAGLCLYFKDTTTAVVGCQPQNASEMYDSINANKIVAPSAALTIADAAAGGIIKDAITYDICSAHLARIQLLSEREISCAVRLLIEEHQLITEPTAALTVAALLKDTEVSGKKVVLVLTGKKIDSNLLLKILQTNDKCYQS